jgi:hypothetical protein
MDVSYDEMSLGNVATTGLRSHVGRPLKDEDHSTFLYTDNITGLGFGQLVVKADLTYTVNGPAGKWAYGQTKEQYMWQKDPNVPSYMLGATPDVRFWLTKGFTGEAKVSYYVGKMWPDVIGPDFIKASATAP